MLDQKREELNLVRKGLWGAATVLQSHPESESSSGDPASELHGQTINKVYQMILAQTDLFVKLSLHDYKSKNLSGVYSGMMDFLKYHLMDLIFPYLCDRVIKDKDQMARSVLAYVFKKTLLTISPILPFTAEENHLHAFHDTSLFSDPESYLLKHPWSSGSPNPALVSEYSKLFSLQSSVLKQQVTINRGRPREQWSDLDLVCVYSRDDSIQIRDWMLQLGLEQLAKLLKVKSVVVVLKTETTEGPGFPGYVLGSFKFGKLDCKMRKCLVEKTNKAT